MSILQEILSEFGNQSDHVIVLLSLSVDINGKIWLVGGKIHSFGVLVIAFFFELSSLLYVEHGVLRLREISGNDLVGLIPFVCPNVHFEGLYELACVHIVLFGKIKLSYLSIVLSDLLIVWSRNFWWLILHQLNSSVPFSGVESCLDGLVENTGLDVVLD